MREYKKPEIAVELFDFSQNIANACNVGSMGIEGFGPIREGFTDERTCDAWWSENADGDLAIIFNMNVDDTECSYGEDDVTYFCYHNSTSTSLVLFGS